MPNYTEIKAEVNGILESLQWASTHEEHAFSKESAKSIVLQLVVLMQRRFPDSNGYVDLTQIIDHTLNALLEVYQTRDFPTSRDMEKEIMEIMFARYVINLATGSYRIFGEVFFQLSPLEIASLLRQISYEIQQYGWKISDTSVNFSLLTWVKDNPTMQRVFFLSDEEQKDLITKGQGLEDPICFSIPHDPFFCLNNRGRWGILDSSSFSGMLKNNQDNRQKMVEIDHSGASGVGYILRNLPENEVNIDPAFDHVLSIWHRNFPTQRYDGAVSELCRQQVLADHIDHFNKADQLLDRCVWESLPAEVRKTVELVKQKKQEEANLQTVTALLALDAGFQESRQKLVKERAWRRSKLDDSSKPLTRRARQVHTDGIIAIDVRLNEIARKLQENQEQLEQYGSLEEITNEIFSIDELLVECAEIGPQVDIDTLKRDALQRTEFELVVGQADNKFECLVLLNFEDVDINGEVDGGKTILLALVNQAVNALIDREYHYLLFNQSGPLRQHYTARSDMQFELFSNAEGELRTQATPAGELTILTDRLVRDPLVRTCFFDVDSAIDGKVFCDIIIGGCLWAANSNPSIVLPDGVSSYIEEQISKDPLYANKARLKFIEFRLGDLILPDQMGLLDCYKLARVRKVRADLLAVEGHFAVRKTYSSSNGSEEYTSDHIPVTSV